MLPRDGAGTTGTGRGPGLERRPGVEEPHCDVLRRAGLVRVDRADDVVGLGNDADLGRVLALRTREWGPLVLAVAIAVIGWVSGARFFAVALVVFTWLWRRLT